MSASMVRLNGLLLLSTLLLLVGAENEALTPVAYWNKMFPNTTMPQSIRNLIPTREKTVKELAHDFNWLDDSLAGIYYRNLWADINHEPESLLPYGHSKRNFSSNIAPLFFLEEDLMPGGKMVVTIKNSKKNGVGSKTPTFLSHKEAQGIPFSISKYKDILRIFSMKPNSLKADFVKHALHDCETHPLDGEAKYCAASLESMMKFAISQLGTSDVHVLATSITNKEDNLKVQVYRVNSDEVKIISLKVVTCHNMMYPYAVFYCHKLRNSRSYMVPLVGHDGSHVNAVAVCHFDTSSWNPGHLSFHMLGVKPGTVPICHFLSESFAWVPK